MYIKKTFILKKNIMCAVFEFTIKKIPS